MNKQYITTNPEVMSGMPVIAGTRIPVSRIVFLLKDGYTLEAIAEEYPHVSLKMLNGAMSELMKKLDTNFNAA